MTIKIKASGRGLDFDAYLDTFDEAFELDGFGAFSRPGYQGEYMGLDTFVADAPDPGSSGFIARGQLGYDMATHYLTGETTRLLFGTGGWLDGETLKFQRTDLKIIFDQPLTDQTRVNALLTDLMWNYDQEGSATGTLRALLAEDALTFKGARGDDAMRGGDHDDRLLGRGGDDHLIGAAGRARLNGGGGDDHLQGGAGRDMLFGGKGHDLLKGGGGRDKLVGGPGDDRLWGGAAADRFDYSSGRHGSDRIMDFEARDTLLIDKDAVDGFPALIAEAEQRAHGVLLDLGQGETFLKGWQVEDLDRGMFDFV